MIPLRRHLDAPLPDPPVTRSPVGGSPVPTSLIRASLVLGSLLGSLLGLLLGFLPATPASGLPTDPEPESIVAPSVRRPVRVDLDERAVPTVAAADRQDALAALGWLHARSRFFQMDSLRRQAAGEMSALAGPMLLDMDRPNAIGRRRERATRAVEALDADERAALEAYTRGVNDGLESLDEIPIEYRLLNATPAAWRPEDSVLVVLTMFDMLQRTADEEPGVAALRTLVPEPISEWLLMVEGRWDTLLVAPDADERVPSIPTDLPPRADAAPSLDHRALAESIEISPDLRPGSNNFAVAGSRTADGRAIVANDPHLAAMAPALWYRVRLVWPGVDAIGVTLPGVPGMPIGMTEHLSWGLTNTTGDFEELVLVEIDPNDPSKYLGPDGPEAFDDREVSVEVAGARPITLPSRHTRWGPVIDESPDGRPIALLRASDQEGAIDLGLLDLFEARDLEAGLDVAAGWGGPSQNVVVADADGRIGWTISGWLPDRRGWDGRSPVTHLDGRGWHGPLPEAERPRLVDPAGGVLQTANNRLVPRDAADRLGRCWADGGRAWRIRERLSEPGVMDESRLFDIQLDEVVQRFLPYRDLLRENLAASDDPDAIALRAAIEAWDGRASAETTALPVVSTFRRRLLADTGAMILARFAVGPIDPDTAATAASAIAEEALLQACESRDPRLEPSDGPSWETVFAEATAAAIASFQRDPDTPWAERNRLAARHPLGMAHPLVGDRFDLPRVPQPGHWGAVRVQAPTFGASTRFIGAPGHHADAIIQIPGGQSGDPRSPNYSDAIEAWAAGIATPLAPGPASRSYQLRPATD